MSNPTIKPNYPKGIDAKSNDGASEGKGPHHAKRRAQHKHWMRVMMEGQATPDLRYQRVVYQQMKLS